MRQRGRKLSLGGMLLASAMSVLGIGCGGCDDGEEPNNVPSITTASIGSAVEGQDINTVINGTDADGDALNYSIVSAPAGASITPIDSTSAQLNWIPTHAQADIAQSITVEVSDGTDTATRTYNVTPENRSTMNGNIFSMGPSPSLLPDVQVTVGSQSTTTDASGYWEITNIPDGTHAVNFKDMSGVPIYETYKTGAKTDKAEEDAGTTTGLETMLWESADMPFVDDTIRSNGEIRKWKVKPKFRIYTVETKNSVPVDPSKITLVKDIIKNELTQFCSDTYNFTDTDIEEIATSRPAIPLANGYVEVFWDDNYGGGWNASYFNGNEITASGARAITSSTKSTWLQELTECMIGSGETLDLAYSDSCLYDPSSVTVYSDDDLKLSQAVYSTNAREAGNQDLGTVENHDVDPAGTIINKSINPLSSTYSTSKSATIDVNLESQTAEVF